MGKKRVLKKCTRRNQFSVEEINSLCSKIHKDSSFAPEVQEFLSSKECHSLFMKYQIKLSSLSTLFRKNHNNYSRDLMELINVLECLDKEKKLESLWEYGLKFSDISSILNGASAKASKAFEDLIDALDLYNGKVTYLSNDEEQVVEVDSNIDSCTESNNLTLSEHHYKEILIMRKGSQKRECESDNYDLQSINKKSRQTTSTNTGSIVEPDNLDIQHTQNSIVDINCGNHIQNNGYLSLEYQDENNNELLDSDIEYGELLDDYPNLSKILRDLSLEYQDDNDNELLGSDIEYGKIPNDCINLGKILRDIWDF